MAAKKTHTLREVDRLNNESVVEGFCIAYDVMDETLSKMMRGLDTTMSIYMRDDLNRHDGKVKELTLIYTVLQAVADSYEDVHYRKLQELKDAFNFHDN